MTTLTLIAAAASFILLLWIVSRGLPSTEAAAGALRQEVTATVSASSNTLGSAISAHGNTQRQDLAAIREQAEKLTESNEARIDSVRRIVDERPRGDPGQQRARAAGDAHHGRREAPGHAHATPRRVLRPAAAICRCSCRSMRSFRSRITSNCAKSIREKYVNPP
jgi:hypothetical protein